MRGLMRRELSPFALSTCVRAKIHPALWQYALEQTVAIAVACSGKGWWKMSEQELLKKWQKRLGLQDWTIKLCVECKPEEMTVLNASGCTEWSEAIKTARIEILDPLYYGDRVVPFNFEKTLVRELLHLKMSFWCQDTDDVEDRVMHQIIDDLARAFTVKDGDN